MPATRIQVFRDPKTTSSAAATASPSTPRRTSTRVAAAAPAGKAVSSKATATRRSVQPRKVLLDGTSLITTNVSSITLDDKENFDPVTGLPLSTLLLAAGAGATKGKGKASSRAASIISDGCQQYIATTITTTILSPLPTTATAAKKQSKKATDAEVPPRRVALGAIRKAGPNAGVLSNLPITSSFPSLADADTEDEDADGSRSGRKTKTKTKKGPRRSLRLAGESPVETSADVSGLSAMPATDKVVKKTISAKSRRTAASTVSAATGAPPNSSSSSASSASKAKKLALAKHTAAVVAATEHLATTPAMEHLPESISTFSFPAVTSASSIMVVSPVKPVGALRRSPRKMSKSGSTSSVSLSPIAGGVHAFEVFVDPTPVPPSPTSANTTPKGKGSPRNARKAAVRAVSPADIALPSSLASSEADETEAEVADAEEDDDAMDIDTNDTDAKLAFDIQMTEMDVDLGDASAAETAAAALQRIIDQRCKELTVSPLADVSDAYTSRFSSVA